LGLIIFNIPFFGIADWIIRFHFLLVMFFRIIKNITTNKVKPICSPDIKSIIKKLSKQMSKLRVYEHWSKPVTLWKTLIQVQILLVIITGCQTTKQYTTNGQA
jgi:hypothetical protein